MRAGTLPHLLSLLLALFTGVVPLRECRPTDGCAGGVVLAGAHGHGHDHEDGEAPGHAACLDSPLTLAAPAGAVTFAASPAAGPLEIPPTTFDASFVLAARNVVRPGDAGIPLGIQGVVLLR